MVFGVLGYFAAPPLLKSILQKQLSEQLHREVSIEKIDINPYGLSARIGGFSIKADGGKEVAGFDELFVNLSTASIFKLAAVVDEVRLEGLRVAVTRVAEGRYDISESCGELFRVELDDQALVDVRRQVGALRQRLEYAAELLGVHLEPCRNQVHLLRNGD